MHFLTVKVIAPSPCPHQVPVLWADCRHARENAAVSEVPARARDSRWLILLTPVDKFHQVRVVVYHWPVKGTEMKLLTGFFAASLAFGAGAGVSAATLDGLTVDITSAHGDCLGVTVGAGEECSVFDLAAKDDDVIAVDVGSSSLRFSFVDLTARSNYLWSTAPTAFNVVVSGLTGFTLTSQLYTAIGGQIGGWVSAAQTGSGEITLTYDDMSMDQGCTNGMICGTLDVFGTVADLPVAQRAFSPGGPLPVPLPASLPLLLAGLGGVGLLGRSRRKPD